MGVPRRVVLLLLTVGTVSNPWRPSGSTLADAAAPSSHPYCAKDMDTNAIPSLEDSVKQSFGDDVSISDVELLQVHAIIRHGARGPYTKPRCWEGYDLQWDCNVTEVVSPSLSVNDGGVSTAGLFRKKYDAYPSGNALQGTCMEGQLLDEGYEQEQANGRHLKAAYLCSGPSCLAEESVTAKELQESGALYLRSDDEQRTVMSGQIVTASMLDVSDVVIDWHTGDDEYDYLEPNTLTCPRLNELSEEAFADPNWVNYVESPLVKDMNDSLTSVWEEEVIWWDVLDCLMTTACSGKGLPEGLTEHMFVEAVTFSTQRYVQESIYNGAAYGKLAMKTFTLEIRERMMGAMNGTSPVKFVLLSGHDTTFIPFMSAVAPSAWDKEWPPYATLATIELLRVGEGSAGDTAGDYFRFVYNGEVLKLEGCEQEICLIDTFLNITQFSVDLQHSSHCCCRNMTQSAVDEYNSGQHEDGGDHEVNTSAPAAAAAASTASTASTEDTSPPPTLAPAAGGVGGIDGETASASSSNSGGDAGSGLTTGAAAGGDGSSGSDAGGDGGGGGGGAIGIAFACFVIGAVVGGVPALMYFRSFRYEQMRGGGHSYEMA